MSRSALISLRVGYVAEGLAGSATFTFRLATSPWSPSTSASERLLPLTINRLSNNGFRAFSQSICGSDTGRLRGFGWQYDASPWRNRKFRP